MKKSLFTNPASFDLASAPRDIDQAMATARAALVSYRAEREELRSEALRAINQQFDALPPGTRLKKGFLVQTVALSLGANADTWSAYCEFAEEVLSDPTLFHSQVGKGGGVERL
jgi:hypothetical protein